MNSRMLDHFLIFERRWWGTVELLRHFGAACLIQRKFGALADNAFTATFGRIRVCSTYEIHKGPYVNGR